jgi:hypothetical protein
LEDFKKWNKRQILSEHSVEHLSEQSAEDQKSPRHFVPEVNHFVSRK